MKLTSVAPETPGTSFTRLTKLWQVRPARISSLQGGNQALVVSHCVRTAIAAGKHHYVIGVKRAVKHTVAAHGDVMRARDLLSTQTHHLARNLCTAQDRARGYHDACEQLGIQDVRFYQANWQLETGVVTAKRMLRKPNDLPDVIFCCNDDLAVGVQETLQDAGIHVPENVMVAGSQSG